MAAGEGNAGAVEVCARQAVHTGFRRQRDPVLHALQADGTVDRGMPSCTRKLGFLKLLCAFQDCIAQFAAGPTRVLAHYGGHPVGACDGDTYVLGQTIYSPKRTASEQLDGCPCLVIGPCNHACTCVDPYMSGGCRRCAKYGSAEQRERAAKRIAEAIDDKARAADEQKG